MNIPFLDGDVARSTSYGVYPSDIFLYSDKGIDIVKFVRRFQNFIGGILT